VICGTAADPHPIELRERVDAAYEAGERSYEEIAVRFSIGLARVNRWVRRNRASGNVSPQDLDRIASP
jgi:transposase